MQKEDITLFSWCLMHQMKFEEQTLNLIMDLVVNLNLSKPMKIECIIVSVRLLKLRDFIISLLFVCKIYLQIKLLEGLGNATTHNMGYELKHFNHTTNQINYIV